MAYYITSYVPNIDPIGASPLPSTGVFNAVDIASVVNYFSNPFTSDNLRLLNVKKLDDVIFNSGNGLYQTIVVQGSYQGIYLFRKIIASSQASASALATSVYVPFEGNFQNVSTVFIGQVTYLS